MNGRFGKDKDVGAATFRDKSVIDYTLCTADSLRLLNDFEIVELDSLFSDGHALLSWSLKSQILPAQNASLAMSTSVLKALPGKLDIKRHSPSILYIQVTECKRIRTKAGG